MEWDRTIPVWLASAYVTHGTGPAGGNESDRPVSFQFRAPNSNKEWQDPLYKELEKYTERAQC